MSAKANNLLLPNSNFPYVECLSPLGELGEVGSVEPVFHCRRELLNKAKADRKSKLSLKYISVSVFGMQ